MKPAWLLLLLPVLAGCAASRYCERSEQVYADAVEHAALQAPEGLEVPPPDPNFAIPAATGEDVQYAVAVTDAGGRTRSRCLDAPPPLPAAALPPSPEPDPEPDPDPGFNTEPLSEPPDDADPVPAGS